MPQSLSSSDASSSLPRLAVSLGDPLGIGPEIIVKSLAEPAVRASASFVIHSPAAPLELAARRAGVTPFWSVVSESDVLRGTSSQASNVTVVEPASAGGLSADYLAQAPTPTAVGGAASLASLEAAIRATKLAEDHALHADAIVTAPISKTSWDLAGRKEFPGHTELLAARYGATRHAMLFVGTSLRVALVTIHVPLSRVPSLITTRGVTDIIELSHVACRKLGVRQPRIAVCGLNPHAGEHGLMGHEDDEVIAPAIDAARKLDIDVSGPFPADALFLHAAKGRYDLVIAMYHDQGLVPIKLLDRERTVNVTIGLPHPTRANEWVPRTSPAHGTAFDIAGQNLASPASMIASIELAVRMAGQSSKR